ncbi:HAD-IB family hydrolase [Actinopolymorpha singaporensis]|uniref:HAD-superfamily subfamily IB hydrolase, TIGR01490 n=1 Tax=Actinopolymorpha singaporensis TaxID=117157 RepID=A0A1H1X2M5_9ACTN|nr:HAD-IB family hydrolase [Actinopolymorpha singaporensis]SDT03604.1 HAD-superfamily subfamily IB hydrolase, TIGR01490 [Actinopolymorpha singaporensis]
MRLRERLDGKRMLLTGVTGFVGEALLHRILRDLPGTHVVALVRPKGSLTGRARMEQLLNKPIFEQARSRYAGDTAALLDARVSVLEGDLSDVPELPGDLDVVIHCAGDVSFDPPIHQAFQTNVLGTEMLLRRILDSGSRAHYLHVSTAYVSGRRRGAIPEGPVDHTADWRTEARWGQAMRDRIEETSRAPGVLSKLRREAEREHRRAGPITSAQDTERRRKEWVDTKLVEAGGERARSLGWTDVYTFTKALGERVVEEIGAPLPVTILRPSIIESALETPHPGWIEGFKMAEPLILAYGRGELPEFPASPDSQCDIVPVDHVVNATLAAAAERPEPGSPAYFQVTSGLRNPLTFAMVFELVHEYFDAHPFDMSERGAVRLPTWRFPGGEQVERTLALGERAHKAADFLVTHAPRGERVRRFARDLDQQRRRLDFLRRYHDLYRPYLETELVFTDDRTVALYNGLDLEDQRDFSFDITSFDWHHYFVEVHCPAVTEAMRKYDVIRRRRGRSTPAVAPQLPAGEDIVAAFDMDGTLLSSNVVETYLWLRMPELDRQGKARELGALVRRLPGFLNAERKDRGRFLRSVYRRYAGADLAELEHIVDEVLSQHVLERVSAAALRRVRAHQAAGHRTVLITGAIRPLTRPLEPLFDEIVAADLAVDDRGRCTGFLSGPPLVGEARAAWLKRYATQRDLDLSKSYAYADSHSDLPMLRVVGRPVAVSPDVHLWREARKGRWPVEEWKTSSSVSRLALPGATSGSSS